jgi:hypothetical protein
MNLRRVISLLMFAAVGLVAEVGNAQIYSSTFTATPLTDSDRSCFSFNTPGYGAVKNTCTGAGRYIGWTIPLTTSGGGWVSAYALGTYGSSSSTQCYLQATRYDLGNTAATGWTSSSAGEVSLSVLVPSGVYSLYMVCSLGANDSINLIQY